MAGFGSAEIAEAGDWFCHHRFSHHLRNQIILLLDHKCYMAGGQGGQGLSVQDRRQEQWPFWSEHKTTPSQPGVPKISVTHRLPERTLQELTQSSKISKSINFP